MLSTVALSDRPALGQAALTTESSLSLGSPNLVVFQVTCKWTGMAYLNEDCVAPKIQEYVFGCGKDQTHQYFLLLTKDISKCLIL